MFLHWRNSGEESRERRPTARKGSNQIKHIQSALTLENVEKKTLFVHDKKTTMTKEE